MRRFWLLIACAACAPLALDSRGSTIASVMARSDESLIRSRPALVAGKYDLMKSDLFSFYRGTLAVFTHDARDNDASLLSTSDFELSAPLVLGNGDPHVENFGALIAADGTIAIEENDFDSADYVPYLFDFRRLAVALVVATYASNSDDDAAKQGAIDARRAIARAAAASYAKTIAALANGADRTRLTNPDADVILLDVLDRSRADRGMELASLTVLDNATRSLIRGAPDLTDPANVLVDLPKYAFDALAGTFAHYTQSLAAPPPAEFFTVIDAARELGSGVASWPRVRALVIVRGPSDDPADDVILEVKEEGDTFDGFYPPYVHFDSVEQRITQTSRAIWARPDASPLWGASEWVGFPVQVRLESEGQKGVKTKRFTGKRGTPDALMALATDLGALVARAHATPSIVSANPALAIATRIGNEGERFADEQADVALAYGDRVVGDQASFANGLDALGPRLGIPLDPSDAPPPDLAALYGTPP